MSAPPTNAHTSGAACAAVVSQPRTESDLVTPGRVEVSVQGRWLEAPALQFQGQTFTIAGKYIKIASLHDEDWLEAELSDPLKCTEAFRRLPLRMRPDLFSFKQRIPDLSPKYAYPLEWDSQAVIRITTFEDWWQQLPRETRKNVRRSEKRGVVVVKRPYDGELVRGIREIQNECPERQGRRYWHYGKTFSQVKRDHAGLVESSDFICAFYDSELIGYLKLVWRRDIASILQLSSKVAHHDKRPANALLACAVAMCGQRRISHLTYGKFDYGNKADGGLREFKIRNGFQNVLVPKYFVPLTPWGKVCACARLYRDLHQILPGAVIRTAVTLRSASYRLTLRVPKWLPPAFRRASKNVLGCSKTVRLT
jgi:hypothetical protein